MPKIQGTCIEEGCERLTKNIGYGSWSWRCNRHSRRPETYRRRQDAWNKRKNKKYRVHLKDVCEWCGFIPEDLCQLDVDHKDGDHNNNAVDNLQTLCANCHRLKTKRERVK